MTSNLLVIGGIAFGYIFFAIMFYSYVSNIENEGARRRAQNVFITINIMLLTAAMAYAYISFNHS